MPWFTDLPWFHLINFTIEDAWHSARFEKESRYYVLTIQKDLLNNWIIVAINGRIKSKLGKIRTIACANYSYAFDKFCTMVKNRYQRGYGCTNYRSEAPFFVSLVFEMVMNQPLRLASRQSTTKMIITTNEPKFAKNTHYQQMCLSFN